MKKKNKRPNMAPEEVVRRLNEGGWSIKKFFKDGRVLQSAWDPVRSAADTDIGIVLNYGYPGRMKSLVIPVSTYWKAPQEWSLMLLQRHMVTKNIHGNVCQVPITSHVLYLENAEGKRRWQAEKEHQARERTNAIFRAAAAREREKFLAELNADVTGKVCVGVLFNDKGTGLVIEFENGPPITVESWDGPGLRGLLSGIRVNDALVGQKVKIAGNKARNAPGF